LSACVEPRREQDVLDAGSRRWLSELRDRGRAGDSAVGALHELLLRMAYARLLGTQPSLRRGALEELANEAADEAVVRVLAHLDEFRGLGRFTTWACQFAITEVSVSLRRYKRRTRELLVEPQQLILLVGARSGCDDEVECAELLRLLCAGIASELTERQQAILRTLAIDGQPPQAAAAAFGANAGALYKSLHDARRKLRAHLAKSGLTATGESAAAR
jgi:RNA polymerase sigma-70 factor (ECF subfamily)